MGDTEISTETNYMMFEDIKHINEFGQEYWLARELARVLQYSDYRNFEATVFKAMEACKNSGLNIPDHFGDITEMVEIGSTASRKLRSYQLSRYACYLIVMNGDPSKNVIATGQTYFAVKTREAELIDNYDELSEDEKRIAIRNEMIIHNKQLASAAHAAGVIEPADYAKFQNYGYMGLYGGLKASDIRAKRKLSSNDNILDHMGSTELAANLFRATQTEEKLRRDHIRGKQEANMTHYSVGEKVRSTIKELGGTMPENLPTPEKSIKQIQNENNKHKKIGKK